MNNELDKTTRLTIDLPKSWNTRLNNVTRKRGKIKQAVLFKMIKNFVE